jgi:outer membrane protein TolC
MESAVRDHIEAVRVGKLRYAAGSMDFLSLLQLQEGEIASQADFIKMRNAQLANRINLHLALGGSFDSTSAASYR